MISELSNVILDIKCYIAHFDDQTWYILYRYDPEFRQYACTISSIKKFRLEFNTPRWHKGCETWYMFGRIHHEDLDGLSLPARIYPGGVIMYFRNGKFHRNDENGKSLPAICYSDGYLEYYRNGELHRNNDTNGQPLPAICGLDAIEYWYNGKRQINNEICNILPTNNM